MVVGSEFGYEVAQVAQRRAGEAVDEEERVAVGRAKVEVGEVYVVDVGCFAGHGASCLSDGYMRKVP